MNEVTARLHKAKQALRDGQKTEDIAGLFELAVEEITRLADERDAAIRARREDQLAHAAKLENP